MNLGAHHDNAEHGYDTMIEGNFVEGKNYLVLDHSSAEVREISDKGLLSCHADIADGKLTAGDYIIGSGAGQFAKSDNFNKWVSGTEHVGPGLKRRLVEKVTTDNAENIGLTVIREVTSVDEKDAGCAYARTKTVHPFKVLQDIRIEALFNAVHSNEIQKQRKRRASTLSTPSTSPVNSPKFVLISNSHI